MRALFLLSCLEPAGSETYCVSLAKAWKGKHDISWISDRLHFGQAYTSMPIHRKAFPFGVWNTVRVLRFVRERGIELIHSHSRRAHWVAAQAAALARIPHVTTIHQPPPVHLFSKAFPCLGDHTIAIDEAVQEHLEKHFRRGIKKLSLIRNGIEIREASPTTPLRGGPPSPTGRGHGGEARVLYLGRLTGGRWRALVFFFNVLKRTAGSLPKTCFQIVGRVPEERTRELEAQLKDVNRSIRPSFAEMHDFVPDLAPLLAGCTGVIAGGRSALESLAASKPVIALGERGVVGLCNEDTWSDAMRTNFGDHFETRADEFYPAKLEISLRQLLDNGAAPAPAPAGTTPVPKKPGPGAGPELGAWGRAQVERTYNIETIAKEVEAVYKDVTLAKAGVQALDSRFRGNDG